jgi:GT2 family glycosyltransferase
LPRTIRKYRFPGAGLRPVDWVTGCCLLARRDCWDDLHGLDPSFFLYYEDVDLCRRAHQRGWSVWHDPDASLIHHRPLHARAVPPHLRLVTRHALLTYATKHWSPGECALLAAVIRTEVTARRLSAWLQGNAYALHIFRELDALTADWYAGRSDSARARLLAVIREQERRDAVSANHPHPQPQSARSPASLSGERHPTQPTGHPVASRR